MLFTNSICHFMSAIYRKKINVRDILKTLTLTMFITLSGSSFANVAIWSPFGGAEKNNGVFVFPSSANSWAGYSNTNESIFSFELP